MLDNLAIGVDGFVVLAPKREFPFGERAITKEYPRTNPRAHQ